MRVAHVMAGARAGGAELFFERLTTALARAGDDVLPIIRRDAERAERLRHGGMAPVELGFGGPLDLLTGPRLRRALRRFAPRVTVAWMNRAAGFTPTGDWVLAGRLGGFYDLRHYRRCQHLIGNTLGIVEYIVAQGWPADRAHYLPNFVPDFAQAQRAALPSPKDAPVLLALGRLHRNKAFDTLLRALVLVPDAHLLIAGEGPEEAALAGLARDLRVADRYHPLGWRTDTAALLAACDVLVCPSRHEPLGNVVIEGWSAERPVVATASLGPTELIANGVNGLLAPVDDAPALAAAIRAALRPDTGARLASTGRFRYQEDFAEAAVVARWRRFLTSLEQH
jgi:glycosyltransferase involved in cell wall biosynthesis